VTLSFSGCSYYFKTTNLPNLKDFKNVQCPSEVGVIVNYTIIVVKIVVVVVAATSSFIANGCVVVLGGN